MPIRPRHERGNRVLRYAVAALLLIAVVGGSAFAITTYLERGDDDDPETAQTIPSTTDSGDNGDQNLAAADSTPEDDDEEGAAATDSTPDTDAEDATPGSGQQQETAGETSEPTLTPATEVETESEDAEVAQQQGQEESGETNAASQDGPIGAAGYLLDVSELPEGWTVFEEGERPREEVAGQLGDTGDELLTSWRWRENPYRNFIRATPENFPNENTFLSISAHRFASEEGAAEALAFFAEIVVTAQGLQDVQMEVIGDESRGLAGPSEGANLYVLYIRHGNYVVRLGGSSATGDPSPHVNEVAQEIVANNT